MEVGCVVLEELTEQVKATARRLRTKVAASARVPVRAPILDADVVASVWASTDHLITPEEMVERREVLEILRNGVMWAHYVKETPLTHHRSTRLRKARSNEELNVKLREMLAKGFIEEVTEEVGLAGIVVPQYGLPKPGSASIRLIVDARPANVYLESSHFILPGVRDLPRRARRCKVAAKSDMTDGYYHVLLGADMRYKLVFYWPEMGAWYAWRVLPQGLNIAPQVFQRFSDAWVVHFRALEVNIVSYLDDFFWMAETPEQLMEASDRVITDFVTAGMRLSLKKTFVLPYVSLVYLGVIVHMTARELELPLRKRGQIRDDAAELLKQTGAVMRRDVEVFLGRIAFARIVFPAAAMWVSALCDTLGGMSSKPTGMEVVDLDADARSELTWWAEHAMGACFRATWESSGAAFFEIDREEVLVATDASATGYGGCVQFADGRRVYVTGAWPLDMQGTSSAFRELLGAILVLRKVLKRGDHVTVVLHVDNSSVAASVAFRRIARESRPVVQLLWQLMLETGLVIRVRWTPRLLNKGADQLSRVDEWNPERAGPRRWQVAPEGMRTHVMPWEIGKCEKQAVSMRRLADASGAGGATGAGGGLGSGWVADHRAVAVGDCDWKEARLLPEFARELWRRAGWTEVEPHVDLFAADAQGALASRWCARGGRPPAVGDGMALDWDSLTCNGGGKVRAFAFPPFSIATAAVHKARRMARVETMLVVPVECAVGVDLCHRLPLPQ